MTFFERLVQRRRAVLATAMLLALGGVLAWMVMPRQEDPSMSPTWGMIRTSFPGADAATVERQVVEPLERELAEVEDVKHVTAIVRAGFTLVFIELHANVDHDVAWTDVQDAIDRAERELPPQASEPELEQDSTTTESVVLAITGSNDARELARAAERLEDALYRVGGVREVKLTADPGDQITVELDDAAARRYGIDARGIAAQIAQRNSGTPGGTLVVDGREATLRPEAEIHGVSDVAAMPVVLPGGSAVQLGELARVRETVLEPESVRMRFDGRPAVAVGVLPREGVHLVDFGDRVRAAVDSVRTELAPLDVQELAYQPEHVETRLGDLGGSLLIGILIVAGLLIIAMGARLGLLVAAIVPLVTLGSLAIYFTAGGILHQMSIAAFVLALGMLVDNAIVVAEAIQRRVDEGESRIRAAAQSVRELALPLGAATGTTVAAFIPMLLATGGTAEFTRAIPVIVILTLALSYAFALVVTPTLAAMFLRAKPSRRAGLVERFAGGIGSLVVRRKGLILAGAGLLLVVSAIGASRVEQDFFPAAGRAELLVNVSLPEGAGVDAVDDVSRRLEAALAERGEVQHVAAFVGRPAPKFYYNIPTPSGSTHFAQVMVVTTGPESVEPLRDWVGDWARQHVPEAQIIASGINQGPPVGAPVSLRLYGDDLEDLSIAADQVRAELRSIAGVRDVRHTLGLGVPSIAMEVDDAALARRGLTRDDLSLAMLGHTRGLDVGFVRTGGDPVPIRIRAPEGQDLPAERLGGMDVAAMGAAPVTVAEVARPAIEWRPALIERRDRRRMVTVDAELDPDVSYSAVVQQLEVRLAATDLPPSVEWQHGGEAEGSSEANAALARTLPVGLFLLVMILLAEFDSFRRVGIVLTTVPLAAVGVVPGLLIGGEPFGFMSTLGAIALIGIVVNNAIVLLDVIERRRAEGASVRGAVVEAVRVRTRPILLTTGTTVAGLLPLALTPSPLWPPLASAMISGLVASSALTLLVVPALYQLLFDGPRLPRWRMPVGRRTRALAIGLITAAVAVGALLYPSGALAQNRGERVDAPAAPAPFDVADAPAAPAPFDVADAIRGEGTPLRSETVARRAVETAPSVHEAQAHARAAEAAASQAFAQVLPRLDLTARAARVGGASGDGFALVDDEDAARARELLDDVEDPASRALFAGILDASQGLGDVDFDTTGNQYLARARLTYPLSDLLLEVLPAHGAAEAESEAARAAVAAARNDIALAAREAYYGWVRARGALAVSEQALEQARTQRDDVVAMVEAGSAPRVDAIRMEAQVAAAEGAVARARRAVRSGTVALETLMHTTPGRRFSVAEDVTASLPPLGRDEEDIYRVALAQRPEAVQLRRLARAHEGRATAAANSALPSLSFDALVDYANPNMRTIPVQDGFSPSWEVGLTLSWSPNDVLLGDHGASASRARATAARARLHAFEDALRRDVADVVAAHRAARVELRAARRGVEAAEVAHGVRRAQLREGAAVLRDVLDADVELTRARLVLLDAGVSARRAEARLGHLPRGSAR